LRALESSWNGKKLTLESGMTNLKISPGYKINTVNSLITGMHEVGTSHMQILDSICSVDQIKAGYSQAKKLGYKRHEYGDITYLSCKS